MLAASSMPLAVPLFLLVVVASAVPATAEYSGARMVIIRSGPGTRVGGGAAGAQSNKWRRHYRRLEDERGGSIDYRVLDKNTSGCVKGNQCATKGSGGSYTRPCMYKEGCPNGPTD
ncbi:hypothetical protein ZEAMMB73_Zm00001d030735 [Zea mays]|uniref:Uncharacterized protein n=1 Tax=Zea mays TaxID=4577 RepID=A0A1D6KE39_MAIZE|nr:hypothetical protein ZEAMMB73_Zm00001d030735 [Zea mays]